MTAPAASLYSGLFDDAALFPPGNAPMAPSVAAHAALRRELGDLVGPFVVPAARLPELVDSLGAEPVPVSVIAAPDALPGALGGVADDERLGLAAVEVPPPADAATATATCRVLADLVPAGIPVSVELPRTDARNGVLDVLAGAGLRAKVRTGGLRADLFPPAVELAGTLAACAARGVPVKCTAGLHAALPHRDPVTGFDHHGFLTVLLAVHTLADGGSTTDAARWLAETSRRLVTGELAHWNAAHARRARARFTSFGTCSVHEPVEELRSLGLLPSPHRVSA